MPATNSQAGAQATLTQIWRWLAEVPDPEIPVISVVDLGIVRDVSWKEDTLHVTVTPTYSGCPAARVINEDIVQHLNNRGIEKVEMERRLSPAWSTSWLSAVGREKLRRYGIAPPMEPAVTVVGLAGTSAAGVKIFNGINITPVKVRPACPQCQSKKTELISQFGSTPCKASYRCTDCLEPFDYFKCL